MAGASTRDRILDVATDLFIEQGYDGTSLREIADRMGFTKAALYYHFPSKEDLLRALLEPFTDVVAAMGERLAQATTIEEWAEALAWTIDRVLANLRLFSLLDRNRGALRGLALDSDFFQEHEQWHQRLQATVGRLGANTEERIRMVCAIAAVAGFDDFGGTVFLESEPEATREHLIAVTREILGLPPVDLAR